MYCFRSFNYKYFGCVVLNGWNSDNKFDVIYWNILFDSGVNVV